MSKSKAKANDNASPDDREFREAQDDPHRLARVFLRMQALTRPRQLRFHRDEWLLWEGTRYRHLPESELRADLTNAIKTELDRFVRRLPQSDDGKAPKRPTVAKVTRGLVVNVVQALAGLVMLPTELESPCWVERPANSGTRMIALANGLLDVERVLAGESSALRPHSAAWFSTVCAPYHFQPDAACPRFLAFIHQVLEHDPERILLLQQWFGYLLVGDTSLQKFLILLGEGANGKTVVVAVLTALLGESNVSTVPLELFGQRFQLTPTLGKLANLVPEIGTIDRVAEGFLKAFVAGDRMHFDRKGLPGIDARPTARLMLATNTLPAFADRTGGVWRRLMILPFRVTIAPNRQDPTLTQALLEELPGIFNWSLGGWRQLQGGRFVEPRVCRQVLEDHRIDSNPAQAFLRETVRTVRGSSIPCRELYDQYRDWCGAHGQKPMPDTQFGKDVQRVFPRTTRRKTTGGRHARRPYHYTGLAWMSA